MSDDHLVTLATSIGYHSGVCGAELRDKDADALFAIAKRLGWTESQSDSIIDGYTKGFKAGLARRRVNKTLKDIPETEDPWLDMLPMAPPSTVPTLDQHLIPRVLALWITEAADRACMPLEMIAIPALVGISSLAGSHVCVQPDTMSSWTTPPNLWGAIVARPGMMKSGAISTGLEPIRLLADRAREDFILRKREMTPRLMRLETALADAKRRKDANIDEIACIIDEIEYSKINELRYTTNDPTVEKLGELMVENPRGLLLVRDELGGWLASMEKIGREGSREFFIESWSGDASFTTDRIIRGVTHIPRMCLSVIGGIQPGRLETYVQSALSGGHYDDGLLQRFQLLVWPDGAPEWRRVDGVMTRQAQAAAHAVFFEIDAMFRQRVMEPMRLCGPAQWKHDRWRDDLENRLRSDELSKARSYEAHISKYRGLLPSLAALFHLIHGHHYSEPIGDKEIELAIEWVKFLEAHARKLYSAEIDAGLIPSRAIMDRIADGSIHDCMSIRAIQRSHWDGLTTDDMVRAGIEELERRNCVRLEAIKTRGRPSIVLRIHPELRRGI